VAYDRASIMLQSGETLELAAARGFPLTDKPGQVRVPIQLNDMYWRLSQSKQPLLLSEGAYSATSAACAPYLPTGSRLGLPLIHSNEVIGMLSLARTAAEPYRPEILPLAQTFAAQAAIALQNARLFGEVQRLATTDALTKLFNRRHFFEVAEQEFERALRYGRPLSLLMLDVDHFKQVNDVYGHLVGDQVLQALAARCRAEVREIDVIGRYGGEEFTVLLPETTPAEAPKAAERLRQAVAGSPLAVADLHLPITLSVGVASLGDARQGLTLAGLIDRADQALYHAKRTGRNRVGIWGQPATIPSSGDLVEMERRLEARVESGVPSWSALTILQAVQRVSAAMRSEQMLAPLLARLLDETLAECYSDTGAIWLHAPAQNRLDRKSVV
jgi:diguanylate cyclase (GGDEF)-like protein